MNEHMEFRKQLIMFLAGMRARKISTIGHRVLAAHFGRSPQVLNAHLKSLREDGVLGYRGFKKGQHDYSILKKVFKAAEKIESKTEGKLTVKQKKKKTRKIFGKEISTTIEVESKEISPKPSESVTESSTITEGRVRNLTSDVSGSRTTQKKTKMKFSADSEKRKMESKVDPKQKRKKIPRKTVYI